MVRAVSSGSDGPSQSSAAVDAAFEAGDFDRAVRLVRLARDPDRLSAIWLQRAEALVDMDRARARTALETVLAIAQRYDGMPSVQARLALPEARARRRLAELAFEDAVGATAIEQSIERLLPLVEGRVRERRGRAMRECGSMRRGGEMRPCGIFAARWTRVASR